MTSLANNLLLLFTALRMTTIQHRGEAVCLAWLMAGAPSWVIRSAARSLGSCPRPNNLTPSSLPYSHRAQSSSPVSSPHSFRLGLRGQIRSQRGLKNRQHLLWINLVKTVSLMHFKRLELQIQIQKPMTVGLPVIFQPTNQDLVASPKSAFVYFCSFFLTHPRT